MCDEWDKWDIFKLLIGLGEAYRIALSLVGYEETEPSRNPLSHTSHQFHRQASKSATPFLLFRLLLGGGSAIIRPISRKEILGTLIFDIPAVVKGAAGWLARIG